MIFCTLHNWVAPAGASGDQTLCPYCARQRVPRIMRDVEKTMVPDAKKVMGVIGDMFFGDGMSKLGLVPPPTLPMTSAAPGNPPGNPPVTNVPSYPSWPEPSPPSPPPPPPSPPSSAPYRPSQPETPPTIVESPAPSTSCRTCGDHRTVGFIGHEVPCPVCSAKGHPVPKKVCVTCGGRGTLGQVGYEISCPVCAPEKSPRSK